MRRLPEGDLLTGRSTALANSPPCHAAAGPSAPYREGATSLDYFLSQLTAVSAAVWRDEIFPLFEAMEEVNALTLDGVGAHHPRRS